MIEQNSLVPLKHLGVIMDGNRRWARLHHKPIEYGHYIGVEKIKELVDDCLALGITELTLYTFSIDNWKRSEEEISNLFSLVTDFFERYIAEMLAKGVHFKWVGIKEKLPISVIKILGKAEEQSVDCHNLKLNLAFNYSGHVDLLEACKGVCQAFAAQQIQLEDIDQDCFQQYLLSSEVSPIDLLIRTSGELRTSDFMPYQLSYSELYFSPIYWPDYSQQELLKAIEAYRSRRRKFGGE